MRPKKHETTVSGDRSGAVSRSSTPSTRRGSSQGKIDWEWIDGEIAPLYSDKAGRGLRPGS